MAIDARAILKNPDRPDEKGREKHLPMRGLLRRAPADPFLVRGYHPRPELTDLVENYWIVRWDLSHRDPIPQDVLPHPCVTLAIDADRSGVFGVVTGRFTRELAGRGRAVGVKFWPGAYHAIHGADVSDLTDRVLPMGEAFGEVGRQLRDSVLEEDEDARILEQLEPFLLSVAGPLDNAAREARGIVDSIAEHREWTRVDDVVRGSGLSERSLQRLLRTHVGVGPKWLIQRYRLHEAVARLESDDPSTLADLAQDLAYSDQAHFTRDFTRFVGRPPNAYLRDLRPDP